VERSELPVPQSKYGNIHNLGSSSNSTSSSSLHYLTNAVPKTGLIFLFPVAVVAMAALSY
jgi:hypothetical protein